MVVVNVGTAWESAQQELLRRGWKILTELPATGN